MIEFLFKYIFNIDYGYVKTLSYIDPLPNRNGKSNPNRSTTWVGYQNFKF